MPIPGIAPAPRRITAGTSLPCDRGRRRFSGVIPAGDRLHLLETGIQAIQLLPYRAGPPARRPVRLGAAAGFLACCRPLHLTDPGKPSDPQTPPPVRARCAGDTPVRLVAHESCDRSRSRGRRTAPGGGAPAA